MGRVSVRLDRRSSFVWLLLWTVVAALVVLPHMRTWTVLSPIDEYQHVDYFDNVSRLELVHGYDRIEDKAMREQACRGIELPGFELPKCNTKTLTPEQFPGGGFNQTYNDPPTYYVITVPIAKALDVLPGVDSIVTAARSVGVLWLGLGLGLTFLLALRLGANRWAAVGASLLVGTSPAIVESAATVTTDAPALAAGAGLCLIAVGVVEGRLAWWWLAPAAAFAMLIKTTSATVVGAVVVFMLFQLILVRRRAAEPAVASEPDGPDGPDESGPADRSAVGKGLAAILVAGGVPIIAWLLYANATVSGPVDEIPAISMFHLDSLGLDQLTAQALSMTQILTAPFIPDFLDSSTVILLTVVVNGLIVLGLAATAWFGEWKHTVTRLAAATLISMLASGPALCALFYFQGGIYINLPGRYALSLIGPGAAVLAAAISRRDWASKALGVGGALSMVLLLSYTL